MELTHRNLTGHEYLATVTDLLQRSRLEDISSGLYEAADFQWMWRKDAAQIPERQHFWFDAQNHAVACLVRADTGAEWSNDFAYLPSARTAIMATVVPQIVAVINEPTTVATLSVREDDIEFRHALEAAGFVASAEHMIQAELANDPVRTRLPAGFTLSSRAEDTRPHHMIRRNGPEIARRLAECSLYRPALDLCVRDAAGQIAAYVLFWMDDITKVGLVEPVRTEQEFQRLGLARHLLAEGIARLRECGAKIVRVNYFADNTAAKNLYHQAGFVDKFHMIEYRRQPA